MSRNFVSVKVLAMALICWFVLSGCSSMSTKQYGLEDTGTITLNLIKDTNVGALFVTHVNGEATGAMRFKPGKIPILTLETVYVNPIYVKLDGKPIVFTVQCPVVINTDNQGNQNVKYKTTELHLTQLSDIKAGDVLLLKWMYQIQTFAFLDATGNIIQQTIPIFN